MWATQKSAHRQHCNCNIFSKSIKLNSSQRHREEDPSLECSTSCLLYKVTNPLLGSSFSTAVCAQGTLAMLGQCAEPGVGPRHPSPGACHTQFPLRAFPLGKARNEVWYQNDTWWFGILDVLVELLNPQEHSRAPRAGTHSSLRAQRRLVGQPYLRRLCVSSLYSVSARRWGIPSQARIRITITAVWQWCPARWRTKHSNFSSSLLLRITWKNHLDYSLLSTGIT